MGMARSTKSGAGATGKLLPPTVSGLEGSRKRAHRQHRRKRFRSKISSTVTGLFVVAVVGGASYAAYQFWIAEDGWRTDGTQRQYTEDELPGVIEQLEETPRFNGNAPPGSDDQPDIEIIEPAQP